MFFRWYLIKESLLGIQSCYSEFFKVVLFVTIHRTATLLFGTKVLAIQRAFHLFFRWQAIEIIWALGELCLETAKHAAALRYPRRQLHKHPLCPAYWARSSCSVRHPFFIWKWFSRLHHSWRSAPILLRPRIEELRLRGRHNLIEGQIAFFSMVPRVWYLWGPLGFVHSAVYGHFLIDCPWRSEWYKPEVWRLWIGIWRRFEW